jgi:hypothetical protein
MIGPIEEAIPAPEATAREIVEALYELEADQSRVFEVEPYRLSPYLSIYGRKWARRFTAKKLASGNVRVWRVK